MPGKFDEMAETFPNVTLIMAHIGEPDAIDAAIRVAKRRKNVYIDTASVQLSTLKKALKEIDQLIEDYKTCYVGDPERTYNMAFVNYCEIGSMLTVAKAIAMGALHRRESRGAHIREDHPKRNDERYLKHSLIKLGADGQYELTERDVVFTKYEPQERKY